VLFLSYDFLEKKKSKVLLGLTLLIFIAASVFVLRDRSIFVFSFAAALCYVYNGRRVFTFLKNKSIIIPLLFLGAALFSKNIAAFILFGVPVTDIFRAAFFAIESGPTASYLNQVLDSELKAPGVIDYHSFVRSSLFPQANFGMARSIYGELFIHIGKFSVIYFPIVIGVLTFALYSVSQRLRGILGLFWMLVSIITLVYGHRNGLVGVFKFTFYYIVFFVIPMLVICFSTQSLRAFLRTGSVGGRGW
jgi:hypothetical protein